MGGETLRLDWGTWALGDLPEVLTRTMEIVGPTATVLCVNVRPPDGERVLPDVELLTPSEDEAEWMRNNVEGCEFISDFDADGPRYWRCLVGGLRLSVTVVEVTP